MVLILDPVQAASIVSSQILPALKDAQLSSIPGFVQWIQPGNQPLDLETEKPPTRDPDEILRHVSIFGDWELRRWFPVKEAIVYHVPTVAGSMTLAALLIAAGFWNAANQRKAALAADQRVSFVNRVSHELRSPLTNILLNTDIAIDQAPDDEKLQRRLGLIREESGRLGRIVDNVLTFARLDRGNFESRTTRCVPAAVIAESVENFTPLFDRKQITYQLQNHATQPIQLDADTLAQIVGNLLSNVEKYAGLNSRVILTSDVKAHLLIVEVMDNGPGIPSEATERIFQPFERVHEKTSEGASGTGLGLAISRELANRSGGSLELLPTAKGASFRLTLPIQQPAADPA